MTLNKRKLKSIGKKLLNRVKTTSSENRVKRFIELHDQGLVELKDGRIVTHKEFAEMQKEPLRSQLLVLLDAPEPNKELS